MSDPFDTLDSPVPAVGWTPRAMHLVAALLAASGFFLFRLAQDMPLSRHECLLGQAVREMRAAGNWLEPTFCGQPRLEKPPLAYWTAGHCLCLFWGPTPASQGDECRAASEVNIVGEVVNKGDLPRLRARKVRVELAD